MENNFDIKEYALREVNAIENVNSKLITFTDLKNKLETNLSKTDYFTLDNSINILSNTMEGIKYYLGHGLGDEIGEKHIKLYGLMTALKMQYDVILELYDNLDLNYYDGNSNIGFAKSSVMFYNFIQYPFGWEKNRNGYLLSKYSIDDYKFAYAFFNTRKEDKEKEDIEYYRKTAINHLEELNDCLGEIIKMYQNGKGE